MNKSQPYISPIAIAAIVTGCGTTEIMQSIVLAEERPITTLRIDANGTLDIPAITTIPPSEFWSSEFKKAYVRRISRELRHPLEPPTAAAPRSEWDKFDAEFDRYFSEYLAWNKEHYAVEVIETKIASIHVGIITPRNGVAPENEHRVLINLHGGGFVMGRGLGMGQIESIPVASIGKIKVITIDYRQAPYYKFPAGTEDTEVVYRALLKHYKPAAIGIFGTSAGGVLTAQALAVFESKGLPRPGAAGIFWAGPGPVWSARFTKQGDSMMWDRMLSPPNSPQTSSKESVDYMDGADPNDPLANPGSSDAVLGRFPSTLFVTGTRAFDMSPTIVTHARLLKLGVDSALYIMEGGSHAADLFAPGTPEQHDVDTYKARWFNQHLAR